MQFMFGISKREVTALPELVQETQQDLRIVRRKDILREDILDAVKEHGHVLKTSPKWQVTRYKDWVLKTSNETGVFAIVRRSISPRNTINACHISRYMHSRNLLCPEVYAVVQWRRLGIVWRECVISQYLPNSVSVEQYVREMIKTPRAKDSLTQFFEKLGNTLRNLLASDVYHSDLSGKNILTADGKNFFFIDLEAVKLPTRYTKRKIIKNAVQIYDSFCDIVDNELLEPFVYSFLPPAWRTPKMLSLIKDKQVKRRRKHVQKVKKTCSSVDPDPIWK